jgi:hypothetical protein
LVRRRVVADLVSDAVEYFKAGIRIQIIFCIRVSEKPGKTPAFLCLAFVCLGINLTSFS